MYNRIMLKLSGEALGGNGTPLDAEKLHDLAMEIKEVADNGTQIGIVCGGGNVIRGKFSSQMKLDRAQADNMGMLATVINSLALQGALETAGAKAVTMSSFDMPKVCELANSRKAIEHLEEGKIVLFAGGTGNPFCSTDSATALRAAEIKADVILIAKNGVDGVYTADPKVDPNAKKYDILTYREMLKNNLQVIDLAAACTCIESGIEAFVFDMGVSGNILKAVQQTATGTKLIKE